MLGPHVIGQRVVIRRIIPGETGPTGGPAFTDTLGVCEDWADGVAVVRRHDDSTVEIPINLIVSGKPVPPRPSVRLRISPREATQRADASFPDLVVEPLGEWLLRWAAPPQGGSRSRHSSCLAMGEPGVPLAEALDQIRAFYAAHGVPPLVQVEPDSDPQRALLDAGWVAVEGSMTAFLIGSVARARRLVPSGVPTLSALSVTASGELDPSDPDAVGQAIVEADHVRAAAVYHRDWVGIHALTVAAEQRRQGLGTGAVRALLDWAAEQGATTVWAQVPVDDIPATTLFEGLAMGEHHRYQHLTEPH